LLNANEHFFLIDCGEGTQIQLRKFRIRFGKINHIFITHLHGDHVFGLFGLISSLNLMGRERSLHIYGPDLLEDLLLDHLKYFQGDLGFGVMVHKINARRSATIFQDDRITVQTIPLTHRVPACGFLFREKPGEYNILKDKVLQYNIPVKDIIKIKKGEDYIDKDGVRIPNEQLTIPPYRQRSYAYCSDTAYDEAIVRHIRGVDILFHEATFSVEDAGLAESTTHATSIQAAEIARKAGVKKLLLGHFSTRYKDIKLLEEEARNIFPDTFAVNDGEVYEVKRERTG
jgi:ribonuclease Z